MNFHSSPADVYPPDTAETHGSESPQLENLVSRRNAVQQLADQDQAILCHPAADKLYNAERIRQRRRRLLAEVARLDSIIELQEGLGDA